MTKKCIVPNCLNNRYSYPRVPLFALPLEERRRKLWLSLIQVNEADLGANPAVCLNHFEKRHVTDHGIRQNLKFNAVPTLKLPCMMSRYKLNTMVEMHRPQNLNSVISDHSQYHLGTKITFDPAPRSQPTLALDSSVVATLRTMGGGHVQIKDPSTPHCKMHRIVQLGYAEKKRIDASGRGSSDRIRGRRIGVPVLRADAAGAFPRRMPPPPSNNWLCDYCMGAFVSRKGLSIHQLRFHYLQDGRVRYYCSICTKVKISYFDDEDDFRLHMAALHQITVEKSNIDPNMDPNPQGEGETEVIDEGTTASTEHDYDLYRNMPALTRQDSMGCHQGMSEMTDGQEMQYEYCTHESPPVDHRIEAVEALPVENAGLFSAKEEQENSAGIDLYFDTISNIFEDNGDFLPVRSEIDVDPSTSSAPANDRPTEVFARFDPSHGYILPVKSEPSDFDQSISTAVSNGPSVSSAWAIVLKRESEPRSK